MKKFSFLWALIFVLCSSLLASCDPNGGVNSPDDPNSKPGSKQSVTDSVIIQVTVSIPACASLYAAEFQIWGSALPGAGVDEYYTGKNVFTCKFANDQAKALVGTTCYFYAILSGKNCDKAAGTFTLTNNNAIYAGSLATVSAVLTKGLNKITLIYSAS